MSREVFSLLPSESSDSAVSYLLALGITGAPVIDQHGDLAGIVSLRDLLNDRHGSTVGECMNTPVVSVSSRAPISEAGKLIGETGYHRLVVTDSKGAPIGIVSAVDVVRGLMGMPAVHLATAPHYDPNTGVSWIDDRVMNLERAEAAPDGPGILALVRGGASVEESIVWVEAANNVRKRLIDILSSSASQSMELQRVLAYRELRFRAALVEDASQRARLVSSMLMQVRANTE